MLNKIKRTLIVSILGILGLFSITACSNKTDNKEVVHKIVDAKPVWHNTVDVSQPEIKALHEKIVVKYESYFMK